MKGRLLGAPKGIYRRKGGVHRFVLAERAVLPGRRTAPEPACSPVRVYEACGPGVVMVGWDQPRAGPARTPRTGAWRCCVLMVFPAAFPAVFPVDFLAVTPVVLATAHRRPPGRLRDARPRRRAH